MADLRSGFNTFQPLSFCKTRQGLLIAANGIDRAIRWDGITTAAEYLGITAPVTGTWAISDGGAGGGSTAGEYQAAYRYTDNDKPTKTTSSLNTLDAVTVAVSRKFDYANIAQPVAPELATNRVKFVEIWRTTMGETRTVYSIIRLGIKGTITSTATADAGASVLITGTVPHGLAVGAVVTIAGTTDYNGSETVTAITDNYTFKITDTYVSSQTGTWELTGYTGDSYTDTQLQVAADHEAMLITNSKGTRSIARRQVVPPSFKPYICMFQDRLWMAGVVSYNVGTVTTTSGSATLEGTGTSWPYGSEAAFVGRYVAIKGDPVLHLITAMTDADTLTMNEKATSTLTNVTYAIIPSREERNYLYYSEQDEPESVSTLNVVPVQENTGDDDDITGLISDGGSLFILKERHIYRLNYFEQPEIDAAIDIVARRGSVNNRTWDRFEGIIYLMDQSGPYAFSGGQVNPIGEPIQNLFRDGTISWTNSKWFFAKVDPKLQVVRFYVQYTGDAGTRPKRWLEYNIRNDTWATGQNVQELGGSCLAKISGVTRTLLGAEDDGIHLTDEGYYDIAYVAGTAGSASSVGDLRCVAGPFLSSHVGKSVYFYAGTGKGVYGRITGYTSATQVAYTVYSGTDAIDSTTKFVIGGIPWRFKTGLFTFLDSDSQTSRYVWVTYEPTTDSTLPATVDVRLYLDHRASPENMAMGSDRGSGIVSRTASDPNTVLAMDATPSTLQQSAIPPGHERIEFHGRLDAGGRGPRFVALEFRGYEATEQPKIYRLEIVGVKEGKG